MTDARPKFNVDAQDFENAVEDGDTHAPNSVESRIRTNSTIMQAKKILGMLNKPSMTLHAALSCYSSLSPLT